MGSDDLFWNASGSRSVQVRSAYERMASPCWHGERTLPDMHGSLRRGRWPRSPFDHPVRRTEDRPESASHPTRWKFIPPIPPHGMRDGTRAADLGALAQKPSARFEREPLTKEASHLSVRLTAHAGLEWVVTPPGLEPEMSGPKPDVLPITPRGSRSAGDDTSRSHRRQSRSARLFAGIVRRAKSKAVWVARIRTQLRPRSEKPRLRATL